MAKYVTLPINILFKPRYFVKFGDEIVEIPEECIGFEHDDDDDENGGGGDGPEPPPQLPPRGPLPMIEHRPRVAMAIFRDEEDD